MEHKDKIIKDFFNLLKTDEGYRIGWQANIAMAFKDVYDWSDNKEDIHTIANIASTTFLNNLLQKKCDWMDIAEKLYYFKNPETKMDVPSSAYELTEKWYYEWQKTEDEDFYNWCIINKNKIEK